MKGSCVVLVAKSAVAAAPVQEMAALSAAAAAGVAETARFAFTEQGDPPLRDVLHELVAQGASEILLVPLLLPMEPSYRVWLEKLVQRWRASAPGPWPPVRIGRAPSEGAALGPLIEALVRDAAAASPVPEPIKPAPSGSVVPGQKRRVLVCMGGPCHEAGAATIWGHLRNRQAQLKLGAAGEGANSAKASCLGPCSLAPVLQVWPEGTFYGGVDEAGVDEIVARHLINGEPVAALAYAPGPGKQTLRES